MLVHELDRSCQGEIVLGQQLLLFGWKNQKLNGIYDALGLDMIAKANLMENSIFPHAVIISSSCGWVCASVCERVFTFLSCNGTLSLAIKADGYNLGQNCIHNVTKSEDRSYLAIKLAQIKWVKYLIGSHKLEI